jgi:hypothetical protein
VNTDLEDLLRSGMERFTHDVPVPGGLARRAAKVRRRRRIATRAVAGAGTAVVAAVAVFAATGGTSTGGSTGGGAVHAQAAAYVLSRVDNAVASKHLVVRATTTSNTWGPTMAWAYGQRSRMEEFTGADCGHAKPNGDCTNQGGSERYLADGTALIHGKLTGVYVTYFDRKWSLSPEGHSSSACSTTGSFAVDGPAVPTSNWPSFIHATIACGATAVTGHVKINGVETLRITGKPVTAKLTAGQAKDLSQKWVTAQWTLYVNPKTYLPARLSSLTKWYGGPAPSSQSVIMTNMQWLPATKANIAKALVTIPPGYHQVKSVAGQQPQ